MKPIAARSVVFSLVLMLTAVAGRDQERLALAEPSSALAAVPKVLARRYRGTIRCRRFAQYPSPSSVCGNEGRCEAPVASKRVI